MGRRRRASGSEPRRQARQAFRLGRNLASPEFTSGDGIEIRGPRPAKAGWGRLRGLCRGGEGGGGPAEGDLTGRRKHVGRAAAGRPGDAGANCVRPQPDKTR